MEKMQNRGLKKEFKETCGWVEEQKMEVQQQQRRLVELQNMVAQDQKKFEWSMGELRQRKRMVEQCRRELDEQVEELKREFDPDKKQVKDEKTRVKCYNLVVGNIHEQVKLYYAKMNQKEKEVLKLIKDNRLKTAQLNKRAARIARDEEEIKKKKKKRPSDREREGGDDRKRQNS